MQLSERQEKIVEIVKAEGHVTGERVAEILGLTRASLRPDLAFLTQIGMLEARPRVGYYYKGDQSPFRVYARMEAYKVRDNMSAAVTVDSGTSVYDAIVRMFVDDVSTMIVVDEAQMLEGISSRKDMLRVAIGKANINQLPIGVIMTRMPNIVVAYEDENLWEVARRLIEHQIDGMPVVRRQESGQLQVVGRVTKTNITKAFVALGDEI